jgi:hypothetical protein
MKILEFFYFSIQRKVYENKSCFKLYTMEGIQNGDWDTEADCVSSRNQGPCWDTGDMLGWGKSTVRAKTSAPLAPSPWKASPCHNTLKEQVGSSLPASVPGCNLTRTPPLQAPALLSLQATAHLPACRPANPPPRLATGLPHTGLCPTTVPGHHPPQEGSSTTRCQLQTCLGDADEQDWMLKE